MSRSYRHRKQLGLSPIEHAREAKKYLSSAEKTLVVADRIASRNKCGAIEHYTDVIAEATVAAVQAHQAMDNAIEQHADGVIKRATRSQRTATYHCKLGK